MPSAIIVSTKARSRRMRGFGLREQVREATGRGGEVEALQERAHLDELFVGGA